MSAPENPPAFPPHGAAFSHVGVETGMTLRDWFAGQALAGLLANTSLGGDNSPSYAYWLADAMLAERAKGGAQ